MQSPLHLACGYRFAGIHSGLRPDPNRRDLALVVSDRPAAAAGVFTQNRVVAAPVQICRERLPRGDARAIVVCSGNANACTGEQGVADARRMASLAASAAACKPEQVLVCSTGVIGRLLPMQVFETGIPAAAAKLSAEPNGLADAAAAILTTDTCIKVASRSVEIDGRSFKVTGFAKGAAMIGPNMATMLGFLLSDCPVDPADLARILPTIADQTFNCISVEGHTSTNDSVLLLANGEGAALQGSQFNVFATAVHTVASELAQAMAADAEGANHLVIINVEGTRTNDEAREIARTVANSALVKTAIYGGDPNWGRFVSAAGYAGVPFEERDLSLWMGDMELYRAGLPLPFDATAASGYLKHNRQVDLRFRFTLGQGRCIFYTCDLTPEYIRLNADYTT